MKTPKINPLASILFILIITVVGCAGQGGQHPDQINAKATWAHSQATRPPQATLRPFGQTQSIEQPQTAVQPTLIRERPLVKAATLTPEPNPEQHRTAVELLEDAQQDVLTAQQLVDDCTELATREAALGWEVDCTPLHDNLTEANSRLTAAMEAAKAGQ